MTHDEVFRKLATVFTSVYDVTEEWLPNGKNSIRLKLISNEEMIFTYRGTDNWSLETVDSYLERLRKGAVNET